MSVPANIPEVPSLPEGLDPLEVTKALAAAALPDALNKLILRVQDDTVSTTILQSSIDQLGKISGLYAKQDMRAAGPGFSIQIVLGGGAPGEKTITFGGAGDVFDEIPAFMRDNGGNLASFEGISACL